MPYGGKVAELAHKFRRRTALVLVEVSRAGRVVEFVGRRTPHDAGGPADRSLALGVHNKFPLQLELELVCQGNETCTRTRSEIRNKD